MGKHITETNAIFPYAIKEDQGPNGRMIVSGIFSLADVKNRNNRVYTRGLWEKTLAEGGDFDRRLQSRLVVGTLGHPADGKTRPAEISHVVTKVWVEDEFTPDCVVCKAGGGPHAHIMAEEEILDTPHGKILKELYRAGVGLGVSSRGSGSVRGSGEEQVVADDFRLETFDHVLDPSTPGAFPKVIAESVVGAVERLIAPNCSRKELSGYRSILANVAEHGEDDDARSSAQKLVEAIDVKLSVLTEDEDRPTNPSSYSIDTDPAARAAATTTASTLRAPEAGTSEDESMKIDMSNPEVVRVVAEQTARLTAERDDLQSRLARVSSEADTLRVENTTLVKQKDEAMRLGEEVAAKLRHTTLQLDGFRSHVKQMQESGKETFEGKHTLGEAFQKSKEIIEALLDQLEESAEYRVRCEAAEDLLAQVRERSRRASVIATVDKILAHESAERAHALRPMLIEGANTPEDVTRKYGQVRALLGGAATTTATTVTEGYASGTPGPAGARPAPAAIGADAGAGLPGPGSINEEHGASLGAGRLPSPVAINESLQRDVNMSRAVLRRIARG